MSRYNIGAYGGVNLSENTPLAGVSISADYLWFRAELDAGWNYTFIQTGRNDFFYLNPSVGLVFGYRYRVFGLVGLTNWPSFDRRKDAFSDSIICPKLKFGGEISLWRDLYVSIADGIYRKRRKTLGFIRRDIRRQTKGNRIAN